MKNFQPNPLDTFMVLEGINYTLEIHFGINFGEFEV